MKLRSYLVGLVIAALLPVALFALVVIVIFSRDERSELHDGLVEGGRAISLAVDRELDAAIRALQVLAVSAQLQSGNLQGFYDEAARGIKTQQYWSTIGLVDKTGAQVLSLRRPFGSPPLPGPPSDAERMRVFETAQPIVSNLFVGRVLHSSLVAITVPVVSDGKVKYALTAVMYPRSIAGFISREMLPAHWIATIIDRNGTIIARTKNFDRYVGRPAEPSLAARSRIGSEETWRDVIQQDVPVYGALHHSKLSGWGVALAVPVAIAEAPYRRLFTLLIVGGAALLLMALGLASLISRRVSTAIETLCDSAAAFGRGEMPLVSDGPIVEVNEAARMIEKAALGRRRGEEWRSRLAAIVDSSDDAIISKTLDGTIVSWNRGAQKIYGYSSEEVVGRSISVLMPPDQPNELPSILQKLGKGEPVEHFRTQRMRKDGAQIDVSLTLSPVKDARGNVSGVSIIARDITENKRAQNELRAQKEILQTIFDHIPIMINFVDERGRILLVNREWERTLGWTLKEITENDLDVFAECYPDTRYREKVLQFLAQSTGAWSDLKTRVKDGRVIDTAWAVVHLSDGTFIGIGQDVTERKRAERELQASQEQLRTLTAHLQAVREGERTHIARELHDEVGQALTGIKLSLERAVRGADDTEEILETALETATELIGKVRDLSLDLRPIMLDDLGLLAALNWHFDRYASQVSIKVDFQHFGLEGRRFPAEIETAAYRIVQEALTNVARHSGADRVEVSVNADKATLHLEIEDNGSGFDTESLLAGATAGVSGMRERAIMVGGQLKIESAPGVGTVLRADLPITDREVSEAIIEQATSGWLAESPINKAPPDDSPAQTNAHPHVDPSVQAIEQDR